MIKKFPHMFTIKFSTKCIFQIFADLRVDGIAPFCKLIYGNTLVKTKPLNSSDTVLCNSLLQCVRWRC